MDERSNRQYYNTMIRPYLSIVVAIIIVIVGVRYYSSHKQGIDNFFVSKEAKIESLGIENRSFVVRGQHLSNVEVWVIPAGTDITENDHLRLGSMMLANEVGDAEVWKADIPDEPLLITSVYAKGFSDAKEVGRATLSVVGATDVYNALWGSVVKPPQVKDLVLGVGQSGEFQGLMLTFTKVTQDSRCPVDVQCIQAGSLKVSLNAKIAGVTTALTLGSPTPIVASLNGYRITMGEITPEKKQGMSMQNTAYRIHFLVEKL